MSSIEQKFIDICSSTNAKSTLSEHLDFLSSKTFVGCSIVHYVASSGRYDILELLNGLLDPTNFNGLFCDDMDSNSPLHYACYYGHYSIVKYILDRKLCNTGKSNNEGKSPCYLAVINKKIDLFPLLFSDKNNFYYDANNGNPLHWGVLTKDSNVIKTLLLYNINICAKTGDGYTPLELSDNLEYTSLSDLLSAKYSHINDIISQVLSGQFTPDPSKLFYPYYHYRDQYERDLFELAIISGNYTNILYFANLLKILNPNNTPLNYYSYKYTLSTSSQKIKDIVENLFNSPLKPIDINKLDSSTPIETILGELSLHTYVINFKEHKYNTILELVDNNLWQSFLPLQYSHYIDLICRRVSELDKGRLEFSHILKEIELESYSEKLILNGFDTDYRFLLLNDEDFMTIGFKIGHIKGYNYYKSSTKMPENSVPKSYFDYLIYSNLYQYKDILLHEHYSNFVSLLQAPKEFFLDELKLPLGHYREIFYHLSSIIEKPKLSSSNVQDQFALWFSKLNLDKYMKPLVDAGYDTSKRLAFLDADTLQSFNFPEEINDIILKNIPNLPIR